MCSNKRESSGRTMIEYIEREALVRSIFNGVWFDNQDEDVAYDLVDKAPAADVVAVVHCKDCQHGKPLDRTKPPFKYYKDSCVLCECEDVVGDEPMVYLPTHFCSCGEIK